MWTSRDVDVGFIKIAPLKRNKPAPGETDIGNGIAVRIDTNSRSLVFAPAVCLQLNVRAMTENDPKRWPAYHLGSDEHLHAIGVMIAAWNQIETAYQVFIQLIFPNPHMAAGLHVFELLGNDERAKLIRAHLPDIATAQELELLDHFLKCANICRDYRNVLAHSSYPNQPPSELIQLTRGVSRDRQHLNAVQFTVDGIREMADAAYVTAQFGFELWSAILARRSSEALIARGMSPQFSRPLPRKLDLPRSWDQIRANPKSSG